MGGDGSADAWELKEQARAVQGEQEGRTGSAARIETGRGSFRQEGTRQRLKSQFGELCTARLV